VARIRGLSGELGLGVRSRPVSGVGSLTPSERRVAALAAAGRRNKDVAQELYVTVKTVETHLARVFTKLGITSRAELQAALTS
jgi:DNA-binding CsgD family transcriptional regulator